MDCIGDACKKANAWVINFIDSVDPIIQVQIERDVDEGKISTLNLKMLEQKQEEIRNKIENSGIDMTVSNITTLLNQDSTITDMVKDVFTFYYTNVMDRIPEEMKNNMTDTVDDIQKLDMSIQIMYCIELICNPENYVLNYETHTPFTNDELVQAMKKCEQEEQDVIPFSNPITGKRDHVQRITQHISRPIDPTGLKRRKLIASGGRKKTKAKKTKAKKTKAKKTKAKKTKAKKTKSRKVKRNTKRR